MHRKAGIVVFFLLLFTIIITGFVRAEGLNLVINDRPIKPDVPPEIVNGRTLVPIRVISETLGAGVEWDGENRVVNITYYENNIILKIDSVDARVNNTNVKMDVPAQIINKRTMVPLRFVGEALGAKVDWIQETRTVIVKKESIKVTDVTFEGTETGYQLKIKGTGPIKYEIKTLKDPYRLIIDIPGTILNTEENLIPVNMLGIKQIRMGQFQVNPDISRIVLDLDSPIPYTVESSDESDTVILSFSNAVDEVKYIEDGGEKSVFIKIIGKVSYKTFELTEPDRVVIDIQEALLNAKESQIKIEKDNVLDGIRMSQFEIDPQIVRVVLDLKQKTEYNIYRNEEGLKVVFKEREAIIEGKFSSQKDKTVIHIGGTGPVNFQVLQPSYNKFIIEIPDTELNIPFSILPVKDDIVDSIEFAQSRDDNGKKITTVIINLPYYYKHQNLSESPSSEISIEFYRSPLRGRRIIIDPGHGGDDPGAIGTTGVQEKILTLDTANRLKDLLVKGGAEVFMTRESDITIPSPVRVELANKMDGEVLISIHFNAYINQKIYGIETLYCPSVSGESKKIAAIVHQENLKVLNSADRGLWERPNLVVLRETEMPAVLTEIGYITNPEEEKRILDPEYRQKAAQALYNALIRYFSEK